MIYDDDDTTVYDLELSPPRPRRPRDLDEFLSDVLARSMELNFDDD